MKDIVKDTIFKYMNFTISDEQNLLDIPVMLEYWLYVVSELESKYHLPIIQAIENIQPEDFTLEKICEKMSIACEKDKAKRAGIL